MDNIANQPAPEKLTYQTLGKKVFWLFFLQMSPAGFILLGVSLIVFALSFQPPITNVPVQNMQTILLLSSAAIFSISLAVIAATVAISWINYINYTFLMSDDSLKIKRGIFNKTENAIPYRQIQNVDIERNFLFQILGLSRLIILTAGHEDEKSEEGPEAEGVIPALDQKLADWMQTELLKRADIQKVIQTNNQ